SATAGIVQRHFVATDISLSRATKYRCAPTTPGQPPDFLERHAGPPGAPTSRGPTRRTDMTHVITEPCIGCVDAACVAVCPVECIDGPIDLASLDALARTERAQRVAGLQLFINPDLCICCGACAPECPVDAIFEDDLVPAAYAASIARNAQFFRLRAAGKP